MSRDDTYKAILAMGAHGGSFIKALAAAWRLADPGNRSKIERTWAEEFARYAAWEDAQ